MKTKSAMHWPRALLRPCWAAVLLVLLAACASTQGREIPGPNQTLPDDGLKAALWMQASAEYRALALGSYALAREQLDVALADPEWDALPPEERAALGEQDLAALPPAVIADADETLIDNSIMAARDIMAHREFLYSNWLDWVREQRAGAIPGAVEFAQYAASRGVTIYYVTNRDAPAEVEATIANLRQLGFPVEPDGSNVMLRGDPRAPAREKGQRRQWIGERHRVLLMLGDNLGDFVDGIATDREQRQALVDGHQEFWGLRWIMLPNPSYGSWEAAEFRACGEPKLASSSACLRSRLRAD